MTLHTLGDSHALIPWGSIPGVQVHYLGPLTMKRAGNPSEPLIPNTIATAHLAPNDTLVICIGEIDIRCWAHIHATTRGCNPHDFLKEWAEDLLDKIAVPQGVRAAVASVVPPRPKTLIDRPDEFPVAGSDADRASYTRILNAALRDGALRRGFAYVDTHTLSADADRMMRPDLADSSVHLADPKVALAALAAANIPI